MGTDSSGLARNVIALTKDYVHHYWSGDVVWCANCTAQEFVWIGPRDNQIGYDPKEFIATHASLLKEVGHITLVNERYSFIQSPAPDIYITFAEYSGCTKQTDQEQAATHQYVTFIWKKALQGFSLIYMHTSIPTGSYSVKEKLPSTFTKDLYRYIMLFASKNCYHSTVELKDILGNVHVLRLAEIIYLEAQKQSTIVHTTDGNFRLREGITNVTEKLNEQDSHAFVRIHRSYAVNPIYINTIKTDEVNLTDASVIPLSTRRRTEAIKLIAKAREPED